METCKGSQASSRCGNGERCCCAKTRNPRFRVIHSGLITKTKAGTYWLMAEIIAMKILAARIRRGRSSITLRLVIRQPKHGIGQPPSERLVVHKLFEEFRVVL